MMHRSDVFSPGSCLREWFERARRLQSHSTSATSTKRRMVGARARRSRADRLDISRLRHSSASFFRPSALAPSNLVVHFTCRSLQPVEPLLFNTFSNFFTFILGGQFVLPQRVNYQRRELSQLKNWMRQRVSSAWGIQMGSFAAGRAPFVLKFLKLFHLHTGRPIPITAEGQ